MTTQGATHPPTPLVPKLADSDRSFALQPKGPLTTVLPTPEKGQTASLGQTQP